jgi:ring-1,2-phenylacetyl-CoA epoxidase subunit PaaC
MSETRPSQATAWVTDDDDALSAVVNLLLVLADNKYFLGRHLSEWAVGSPSLETGVAIAAIAQGELGQARVLHPLLQELPFPHPVDPLQRTRTYNVSFLERAFPSWSHAVGGLLLVDGALTVLLEALRDSPYEALARRVPRMLEEEEFHWDFAEGRARELVGFPGGLQQLQARVDEALEEMLCWFGQPNEPGVETLRGEGLLKASNEQMRQTYLERVGPLLQEVGVRLPLRRHETMRRWDDGDLPWERWNRLQRRLEPVAATTP